ncbi:MAG: flippase-like domain-containing protein [Sedimentisphaerales bacterium]|nr:flippase-like domain-containing protein [Sedimentisphaerales bacterium]
MNDTARKIVRLVLRLTVTAALLWWVAGRIDFGQFWQAAHATRWQFVVATWLLTASFSLVQSAALQVILRKQNCHVRLNTLFGASAITALYSLILPGILSTGVKWYVLKRDTGKGSQVFSSMVYNQIALFVTVATIGLIAVLAVDPVRMLDVAPGQGQTFHLLAAVLLGGTVLFTCLLLNTHTGGALTRVLDRLVRPLPHQVRLKVQEMLQQIAAFQSAGPVFHSKVAGINAVATLLLGVPAYIFAAWAAGFSVPPGVSVFLHAGVYVLSKLPVTVANLGLREMTLVGVLTGYGISASSALLMSMVLFSAQLSLAALGGGYQLFWPGAAAKRASGRGGH